MPHTRFIHMLVYDLEQNNTINLNGFAVQIDGQFLEGRATRSAAVPHLFFFPWSPALYGAGLHTLFAFPMIEKLLKMMVYASRSLYLVTLLICFAVFTIFYIAVYLITSKAYTRIIDKGQTESL